MKAILSTINRGASEDLEYILYESDVDFTCKKCNGEYVYTIRAGKDDIDGLIENEINKKYFKIIR